MKAYDSVNWTFLDGMLLEISRFLIPLENGYLLVSQVIDIPLTSMGNWWVTMKELED